METGLDWTETLPRVIRMHHDMEGPSGLTPYQIVFGRERSLAGLPFTPTRECEDAESFFKRMEEQDQLVAEHLNEVHKQIETRHNARKSPWEPLQIGEQV